MKKLLVLLIIVAVAAFGAYRLGYLDEYVGPKGEAVDQAYVRENVGKAGVVLVDVRSKEVYDGKSPREGIPGGHIPGAINFPMADLEKEGAEKALADAGITKDATLIVYCNTGHNSTLFVRKLVRKFGYDPKKIMNYMGSMTDWSKNPENKIDTAAAE
ncbi:MAG: sulfurtransferase [Pyramidobacter sp.]